MDASPSIDLGILRGLLPGSSNGPRRGPRGPAGQETADRGESSGIRVSLSAKGLALSRSEEQEGSKSLRPKSPSGELPEGESAGAGAMGPESTPSKLTDEEQREVEELSRRDREVRAHEAAHKAAAGNLAKGGASFDYETGPDGRRYAVGGEVSIDTSPVEGDAAATARKMERVQAAALAPADPSAQDRQAAAQAAGEARQARSAAAREAMGPESNSAGTSASPAADQKTNATASCPVCGANGHGPEQHSGEIDFHV